MLNFFLIIWNWLKIPFQITFIKDPPNTLLELKKISDNHIILSQDSTFAYYSHNLSADGFTHDSQNQVVNQSIFMYLYNASDLYKNAMLSWIYWNLHGGRALSNGIYWGSEDKKITYSGINTSTETLSALCLLMLKDDYTGGMLPEYFENLINTILENDNSLNLICNPGGKISKKYDEELKKKGFCSELVKIKNLETDMSLGCSPDKAVTFLACLTVLVKVCGDKKRQKLLDKYKNLYGYGLKSKITSNSLEAIISLYVLWTLTKDENYRTLLLDKFEMQEIDTAFGNYLYAHLLGVK